MFAFIKSWKFWVIFAVSIIGVIGLTFGTIKLVKSNTKIATPTNLEVVSTTTGHTYISVDYNPNASNYVFVITVGTNVTKLDSTNYSLDITEYISSPATYKIKAKAIAKNGYANSKYCATITHISKTKLASPTLELNTAEKRVYFTMNSSYNIQLDMNFELYYGASGNNTYSKITAFTTLSNDNLGHFSGYFNIASLTNGEYRLSAKAVPTDTTYFLASDLSNYVIYNS